MVLLSGIDSRLWDASCAGAVLMSDLYQMFCIRVETWPDRSADTPRHTTACTVRLVWASTYF